MNTKHALYMLTVLQEGNITNAAKKLYISQPSLSQMIKLVEKNLNTSIFNRNTEPITLTYAGQKYMEAAQKILAINGNLLKEIGEINSEEHGKIRLGCSVQRGLQVLPVILPQFINRYPHVDLELVEHGSTTLEAIALEGKLDFALVTTSPKYSAMEYQLIENEQIALIVSKDTELAKRIPTHSTIHIKEAQEETFVALRHGHSVRNVQDNLFFKHDMSPKILIETNNIDIAQNLAVTCNSAMLIPANYINPIHEANHHSIYFLEENDYERHFYLSYRKDIYLTKYMKEFIAIATSFHNEQIR